MESDISSVCIIAWEREEVRTETPPPPNETNFFSQCISIVQNKMVFSGNIDMGLKKVVHLKIFHVNIQINK